MTTATITETLALPADGSAATLGQCKVRLRLVAANDGVATGYTSSLTAVVEDAWAKVSTSGLYSFTGVRPNSGVSGDVITTPAGTVYELTVVYPSGTRVVRYLDVPDSAGPHAPGDILTIAPDAIVDSAVAQAIDQTTGVVETFETDGALPSPWLSASALSGQSAYWDAVAVLDGKIVIPTPDTGAVAQAGNSGARGVAYRDFSAYSWAGDDIEVSVTVTFESPYEASPLLHIDTAAAGFGIGCWPVYDFAPGGAPNSYWLLGVPGRRPDQVLVWDLIPFTYEEGVPQRLSVRSSNGAITVLVDGVVIVDAFDVPSAYEGLLGSKVHGIALDNGQSDENGGAGGARPANKGAARQPWVLAPITGTEVSANARSVDALLAKKSDRTDLDTHIADTVDAHDATAISYAGETGISATTVEAAIDELATEKANLAGATFTGAVTQQQGAGAVKIADIAGVPNVGVHAAAADAEPTASLGILLGAGGLSAGAGGSSAADTFLLRLPAGNAWQTAGGTIEVGNATANAHAVNRTTGDGRWLRTGQAALVNADVSASAAIAGTKVDAATETVRGTVELANSSEAAAGVATGVVMTAANVNTYVAAVLGANISTGGSITAAGDILATIAQASVHIDVAANGDSGINIYTGGEAEPRMLIGYVSAFSFPVLSMGAGGASAPDLTLYRSGAAAGTLTGTLSLSDATAATHAVNRQTADARYETSKWVSALEWNTISGAARAAYGTDNNVAVMFDAAAVETVVATVRIPSHWLTCRLDAWWTNAGAGSGNVVWASEARLLVDTTDLDAVTTDTGGATVAAPSQDVTKVTTLDSSVTVTGGGVLVVHVTRTGTSGSDTLANDAGLIGLDIVRLT